jgi:hypothetical protein
MADDVKYWVAGIAIASIAVATGVGIWYYYKGKTTNGGCTSNTDCQTGHSCVNGQCVKNQTNPCQGLGSPCSSNSQCPECQTCIGGCCQTSVPYALNDISSSKTISGQTFAGNCGSVPFGPTYCNNYKFTNFVYGTSVLQVTDSYGNPVPCQSITITSQTSYAGIFKLDCAPLPQCVGGQGSSQSLTLTTDSSGKVQFGWGLNGLPPDLCCPGGCELYGNCNGNYVLEYSAQVPGLEPNTPLLYTLNYTVSFSPSL